MTVSKPEVVYAVVTRAPEGRGFFFAQETKGQRREVFCHLGNGRKFEDGDGRPWFLSDQEAGNPKEGDKLCVKILEGDRGWRALFWGFDQTPHPLNYTDNAEQALRQFMDRWQDLDGGAAFRELLKASPSERQIVGDLFHAYARERVNALVKPNEAPSRMRWWTAIATLEFVLEWPKHIGRILKVPMPYDTGAEARLKELKQAQKAPQTDDPVEKVVRRIMELRDAGKPFSADDELRAIVLREQGTYETARTRRLAPSSMMTPTPMWDAFGGWGKAGDLALSHFWQGFFHFYYELQKEWWKQIEQAGLEGRDSEIAELWEKAHATDPKFRLSLDEAVTELLAAGRFATLKALRPLLADDAYAFARKVLEREWPTKVPVGPFSGVVATMQQWLEHGGASSALALYDKYVVKAGKEAEFLAVAERAELVKQLREVLPIHELGYECDVLVNGGGDMDATLERFYAVVEIYCQHPQWPRVCEALIWALQSHGRVNEATKWLSICALKYPDRAEQWAEIRERLAAPARA